MNKKLVLLLIAFFVIQISRAFAQSLPGDSLVYGPMFSAVYNDSVRVWVMLKNGTGSGNTFTLEVTSVSSATPLSGVLYNTDTRLGYELRSYVYKNILPGQTYTAKVKKNTGTVVKQTQIKHEVNITDDFEFLAGGCGRIMDMTRCVDQVEGPKHINGNPSIYKHMANEGSDLMVWLGDALYLFGIEHSDGRCPGMVNDWDNRDALFSRYNFNRQFHDSLLRAMPQLVITDNHDVGGNEFNKTMPTLGLAKDNFKNWWQNPHYLGNQEGPGLYSSYRYKDVEYFLLDNRSYRGSTIQHLGPDQLTWLKQALLNSTATYKVLISGTPAFNKGFGGRNFSITAECDDLIQYIKTNNINGIICYSADIHQQQFYGRYNDHTYPFYDVLSGNLASDIGAGSTSVTPDNDAMFNGAIQTYTRTNVYGPVGDRRLKLDYVSPDGIVYYSTVIHSDMLVSIDDSTRKVALSFSNVLKDSSKFNRILQSTHLSYVTDRKGKAFSAAQFDLTTSLTIPYSATLSMNDRAFSITYWIKPSALPSDYAAVFSNSSGSNGYSLGIDNAGSPVYIDHASGTKYISFFKLGINEWTHITWKYDNVKLQLTLYSNGQLVQKWSNVTSSVASSGILYLGTNSVGKHFVGALDEFVVYGKLISDKTVTNVSEFESSRGTALSMNGSQDMVIPSSEINTTFGGSFTVEFWARATSAPATGNKMLSCNGRVGGNSTGFSLEFSANKKLNLAFGNNGSGWTTITDPGTAWNAGEWNHIAMVVVPGDSIYMYQNGVKTGKVKYTSYFVNTYGLALGKSVAYGAPSQAEMDEFRIWNIALSQDSIIKRMHYILSGQENHLVFYYDFTANTTTSIKSKGSNDYQLTLNGAELKTSTAPVANIPLAYRSLVKGNWSVSRNGNSGLTLEDVVTSYISNLVVGKNNNTTTSAVTTGSNIHYLNGAWLFNPLNTPVGTLRLDLSKCLTNYNTVISVASEYYLLNKDDQNQFNIINTGYYDGRDLWFLNTQLDSGAYYLGWKEDPSSPLFGRKGALSLRASHTANIPYADVNPVLSSTFTIEFWGRIMQYPPVNSSVISNHARVSGNTTGLSIEIPADHTLNAVLGTNGSGWITIHSGKEWKLAEWNHIALTVTPNQYAKLYVNGEIADSTAFTTFTLNQINLALASSINYNNECIAMLDEVRIWSRAKTKKEIQDQMHLSIEAADPTLQYQYTFNHPDNGAIINTGLKGGNVALTNAVLVPSTAPIGNINVPQQYKVTGSWSVRDSSNTGLSVAISIPDYETNLIIGKDNQSGKETSPTSSDIENLLTIWQIDALKVTNGQFTFDGPTVLGSLWTGVKASAIEFYLLRKNITGELTVQAVGTVTADKITFTSIDLTYGEYTLGWKNNVTGLIDKDSRLITIYPNPSQDYIILNGIKSSDIDQLYVHDINGQNITVQSVLSSPEVKINISHLSPGMYTVVFSDKQTKEKTALRLIKQ